MINSETTVNTPRALAGAGPPSRNRRPSPHPEPGLSQSSLSALPRAPPPEVAVHPDDPRIQALVACPLEPVTRQPRSTLPHLPAPCRPALLSSSGSRYPASPRAWNPCPPLAAAPSPAPRPELPGPRAGQGRSRLRAASQAGLAAGGGPAVSQRGRPARAAGGGGAEDGLGRALGGAGRGAGGRAGAGGGVAPGLISGGGRAGGRQVSGRCAARRGPGSGLPGPCARAG